MTFEGPSQPEPFYDSNRPVLFVCVWCLFLCIWWCSGGQQCLYSVCVCMRVHGQHCYWLGLRSGGGSSLVAMGWEGEHPWALKPTRFGFTVAACCMHTYFYSKSMKPQTLIGGQMEVPLCRS